MRTSIIGTLKERLMHRNGNRHSNGCAGRVLMLVENPFPLDVRVKNEAYTLASHNYKVIVIALRRKGEKAREVIDGILVYRIPEMALFAKTPTHKSKTILKKLLDRVETIIGYFVEHLYFTLSCLFLSIYIRIKDGFDIVHAHNPPDTLFFVGAFHRLLGKKYVFDHHDLSPELYLSRYGVKGGMIYRVLIIVERFCLRLSNLVIATNNSYKEIEVKRSGIKPGKVFVVRNGPDLKRVRRVPPDDRLGKMGKTILVYIGIMNPQDGIDYLLRALRYLVYDIGRRDFYCVLIGPGDALQDLKRLAVILEIEDFTWFTGFISEEDLLRYLSAADICVDPDPSSPLNDVSTWIKIMEYMAIGKPIVSFDLKETRYTAQEAAVYVPPNNEEEFARAIERLIDDPKLRDKMGKIGMDRIKNELAWEHVSENLLAAYQTLSK